MLASNPENVRFLIERLGELEARDALERPEGVSAAPGDADAPGTEVGDPGEDALESALRTTVEDLERDRQQELRALLWLGRGDFALDERGRARAAPLSPADRRSGTPAGPAGA